MIRSPALLTLLRTFEFPRKLGFLEQIYGRRLSSLGTGWVVCANGVEWKLDLSDSCHRWIVYGKYEGGGGINLARERLRNGGVYVDSGANIGQWLLYIASLKGLKTIAFEPTTSERNWLTECVNRQKNWSVSIVPLGLGAADASVEIQTYGARSTLNLDWYQAQNHKRETINLRRLDDVLAEMGEDKVTFWKLDVEGAELEALKGAEAYLQEQKIETIYFECHPTNFKQIKCLLESHRYQLFDLAEGKLSLKTDSDIENTEDLVAVPIPPGEAMVSTIDVGS